MLFNKKFDLIISLGEDCACSSYLRRLGFQEFSYPFDWLTKFPFDNRIKLLLDDFKDFLQKENLRKIEKPTTMSVDNACDYYEDFKYDIYFYHDFKSYLTFDAAYNQAKEKYDRRIKRLFKKIQQSKNILFVWWSRDKHLDIQKTESQLKQLQEKFKNNEIYLLIIEDKEEIDKQEKYSFFNNYIVLIKDYLVGPNKHSSTMGIEKTTLSILKQIKYNSTVKNKLKNIFLNILKFIVKLFVPNNEKRAEFYRKLQYIFLKAKL